MKTDIVDVLKNMNVKDDFGFIRNDVRDQAVETIEKLRAALRKIGYDYVELSYDKIEYFYREHMMIARKAYQESFPEQEPIEKKPLDNNF